VYEQISRAARSTLAGVLGIVFDLFHTLVDPEDFRPRDSWRLGYVADVIGANGRDLIMFWKDTYDERTTSPISGTELIRRYAADNELDVSPEQQARIAAHLGDYQDLALEQPRTEVVDAVADLAQGHPLAVLSNCYIEEVTAWPRSPLAPYFAGASFSYDIGARKPDPTAYLAATSLLGLDAEDCAFVGNGSSNELAGAKDAGFALVVHQNQFNQTDGLVPEEQQARRASQADAQITSLGELDGLLG
jgi:putative hydrolase of the HAD superfamily